MLVRLARTIERPSDNGCRELCHQLASLLDRDERPILEGWIFGYVVEFKREFGKLGSGRARHMAGA